MRQHARMAVPAPPAVSLPLGPAASAHAAAFCGGGAR